MAKEWIEVYETTEELRHFIRTSDICAIKPDARLVRMCVGTMWLRVDEDSMKRILSEVVDGD